MPIRASSAPPRLPVLTPLSAVAGARVPGCPGPGFARDYGDAGAAFRRVAWLGAGDRACLLAAADGPCPMVIIFVPLTVALCYFFFLFA